jgi:hypothetical protein
MKFLTKEEIKALTGKSETTVKKFIQKVKNGAVDGVSELVQKEGLTSQQLTRNKQIQILVNEIFVKSYFNIDGFNDEFKNQSEEKVNQLNEPVNQSGVNDLLINKLSNEVEYLRGLLAEKERKNDELTTQLMSTNNRLFEITETNQKLLQNQQILQQTQQTKSIEEDTQKPRKWWQFKK